MPLESSIRQTDQPDALVVRAAAGFIQHYKTYQGKLAEAFGYPDIAIEDFSVQLTQAGLAKHIGADDLAALDEYVRENSTVPADAKLVVTAEVADRLPPPPYEGGGHQIMLAIDRGGTRVAGAGDVEIQYTASGTSMTSNRASIEDIFSAVNQDTLFISVYVMTQNELNGVIADIAQAVAGAGSGAQLDAIIDEMQKLGLPAEAMQMVANLVELRALSDAPATPQTQARMAELGNTIAAQLAAVTQTAVPAVIAQMVQTGLSDMAAANPALIEPVAMEAAQAPVAMQAAIEHIAQSTEALPAEVRAELGALLETLGASDVQAAPAQIEAIAAHIEQHAPAEMIAAQQPALDALQGAVQAETARMETTRAQAAQDIAAAINQAMQTDVPLPPEMQTLIERLDGQPVTPEIVTEALQAAQAEIAKAETAAIDTVKTDTPASETATVETAKAEAVSVEAAKPDVKTEVSAAAPQDVKTTVQDIVAALSLPRIQAMMPASVTPLPVRAIAVAVPAVAATIAQAAPRLPAPAQPSLTQTALTMAKANAASAQRITHSFNTPRQSPLVAPAAPQQTGQVIRPASLQNKTPPLAAAVAQLNAISAQNAAHTGANNNGARNPVNDAAQTIRAELKDKGYVTPETRKQLETIIDTIPSGPQKTQIEAIVKNYSEPPANPPAVVPVSEPQREAIKQVITAITPLEQSGALSAPVVETLTRISEGKPVSQEDARVIADMLDKQPELKDSLPAETQVHLDTVIAAAGGHQKMDVPSFQSKCETCTTKDCENCVPKFMLAAREKYAAEQAAAATHEAGNDNQAESPRQTYGMALK